MRIDEYLDTVCREIKWKAARKPVREEILAHIAQRANEYRAAGESAEQAEEKAVANMGDAEQTGLALNELHRQRFDWVLIAALALLLVLGVYYIINYRYFQVNTIAGLVACILFVYIDLRKLLRNKYISIAAYFIFLTVVLAIGLTNNFKATQSSYTDILLTRMTFICSVGMIISMGIWAIHIRNYKHFLFFILAIGAGILALIVKPAFSIAVTFIVCAWVMLWAVNIKYKRLIILALTGTAILYIAFDLILYINNTYTPFIERIQRVFLESGIDRFLINQARLGVTGLNWFGPGNMFSSLEILPNNTSDFALLGFMCQYGITAGLGVISLCGVVIWRLYSMLLRIKDAAGRAVSLGLCTFITVQIVWSILINFGILPNLIMAFIPMFTQVWMQSLVLGSVLGIIIGLYRKKDIYKAGSIYRNELT